MLNACDGSTGSSRRDVSRKRSRPHWCEMEATRSRYEERIESGHVRHWVTVLRDVRDQGKACFHRCSACAERAGASPVMRSAFQVCPEGEPKLFDFQQR